MESLLWHLTNRTAETLLILNLFHLLLTGLAVMVLLHQRLNRDAKTRADRLITAGFALLALSFALLTLRFGAVFFLQEQIGMAGAERISHALLVCGAMVIVAGYLDAAGAAIGYVLGAIPAAIVLLLVDLSRSLPSGDSIQRSHSWPMLISDTLAVGALILAIRIVARGDCAWPGRGMRLAALLCFTAVFALHGAPLVAPAYSTWGWNLEQHLLTITLCALTWAVGERSRELLDRVFVRLNLLFLILASLVMLITAGMEKYQYFRLAEQRSVNLAEFLRGHVVYYGGQGESVQQIFSHPEVLRRVVTEFGTLPELREVNVYIQGQRAGFRYSANWEVNERIVPASGATPTDLKNSFLMIRLPIEPSGRERVEFVGTLDYVNTYIGRYILFIYSAFTIVLGVGVMLIGIIVADTDRQLRRRYAELQDAQQQLANAAKLASIGELAGGMAHEINNPITSILALASHMASNDAPERTPRARKNLHLIVQQSERIAELVRGLLTFSRQTQMHTSDVDLRKLLCTSLDLVGYRARDAGIVVRREIDPRLPHIRGDASRLTEVMVNLLANAIDAMPNGGVLAVRAAEAASGEVRVEVHDTGEGIPPERLPRIFDPFFTTKEPGRGTGLGLSISHGIVKDHGGEIWAQSEPGKGTMFVISLNAGGIEYAAAHSCD
jgi:two-component system, NtrC family, sensor kinase